MKKNPIRSNDEFKTNDDSPTSSNASSSDDIANSAPRATASNHISTIDTLTDANPRVSILKSGSIKNTYGASDDFKDDSSINRNFDSIDSSRTRKNNTRKTHVASPRVDDSLAISVDKSDDFNQLLSHTNKKWFKLLFDASQMPEKASFVSLHDNSVRVAAIYCLAAASYMYIQGGATEIDNVSLGSVDLNLFQVGGVSLNAVQSYYFCVKAIEFLVSGEKILPLIITAGTLALFSAVVFAIAQYTLSDDSEAARIVETLLNFSGNYPQFLYGMLSALIRLQDSYKDNPRARRYVKSMLLQELNNDDDDVLYAALKPQRGQVAQWSTTILGQIFGTGLTLSMAGYFASTLAYMRNNVVDNKPADWTLALTSNLPMAAISQAVTGTYVANAFVDAMANLAFYIRRKISNTFMNASDRRELIYFGFQMALNAFTIWMATFSGATSHFLMLENTPNPLIEDAPWINDVLEFSSNELAQAFNGAMAIMAINETFDYLRKAYVATYSSKHAEYIVEEMDNNIDNLNVSKIEKIARAAGMKEVTKASTSRFAIFNRKQANTLAVTAIENDRDDENLLDGDEHSPDINLKDSSSNAAHSFHR